MPAIDRAIVIKGGRSRRGEGPNVTAAPFIVVNPASPSPSCSLSSQHYCRQASLMLGTLVESLASSQRYLGVVVVGLEDLPPHSSSSAAMEGRVIRLSTQAVLQGWLATPSAPEECPAVEMTSPRTFVESISRALAQHGGGEQEVGEGEEAGIKTWAVVIDSVACLVSQWGLAETFEALRGLRRCERVSPVVTVLHPEGLAVGERRAVEDLATTNLYLHHCDSHGAGAIPDHGKCLIVRRSSSGRVQQEWDFYKVGGQGEKRLVVTERSSCSLDAEVGKEVEGKGGAESSSFLDELSFKLRLSEKEKEARGGVVLQHQQPPLAQQSTPLIYLEEGDIDEDDDEDDGLDDDLDI